MKNKKIIIAGGTGFIGQELTSYFGTDNEIIILTRQVQNEKTNAFGENSITQAALANTRFVKWDAATVGDWATALNGADLVINLAGKTVNCRYNEKNKKEIFNSRTNATKAIGAAIQQCSLPPKLWINAASTTIYPHATDTPRDESFTNFANDFSVQVCKLWEKTFYEQVTPQTRKIALRMAITLGAGGVMTPYFNLLKFGLGGRQGSGKQMYSWVHVTDTCRMIEWLFNNAELNGTYNCVSPNAVTNIEFMKKLRSVTGHVFGLPAYEWMLAIGAPLIGTETELVLKSRWVLPTKMLQSGFAFMYNTVEEAFKNIISKTPRKKYLLF
jgi:uncharacterized protein (TIGR01777 family)